MAHHRSLPFIGLLVLASFVAMVAGVGDVSKRTSDSAPAAVHAGSDAASTGMHPGRHDP